MFDKIEMRKAIHEHLEGVKSAGDVYSLFKLLGYPNEMLHDSSYKRKKSGFDLKKDDERKVKEIYSVMSFDDKLQIFLVETEHLSRPLLRSVTETFDKQYLNFMLIFTSDYSEIAFVLPEKEKTGEKHKLKTTILWVDRKNIHYTDAQTISNLAYQSGLSNRDVWKLWKKAFSVEMVTEEFFENYKEMFLMLRNELNRQGIPKKHSHEFALQFLNRIMFIYFVSKKDWLEHTRFVGWLWNSYKKSVKIGSDEFYERWLKQIFFKAFNNKSNEISGLPDEVVESISNSPYLNGGLFRQNEHDSLKIRIADRMFQKIFEFFEKYNFTIKEDMPLEQEVAVDPQMIGYVYESLANVADEIYDRNDMGIFYTPRVEVDFMCRRSLVEYLSKRLPDISKDKFYHLVFDPTEDKDKIAAYFEKEKLWPKLEDALNNLSVVDPACGSGAFLVGMMNVIAEIYRIINRYMGRNLTDFRLKSRIIQYSLYGVDVMPWAIHAAELRLWLQLIVETKFSKDELRKHPLLPNLNLNLRVGDSLVQEIGGMTLSARTTQLKPHLKQRLDDLKQEKRKYFETSPNAKFRTVDEVKNEEVRLFEEIIGERIECQESDIEVLESGIRKEKSQKNLSGESIYDLDKIKEFEKDIAKCREEIEKLKKIRSLLKDPEKKPFVWDIDFAEIFGDKNGFDIVIGNPPYVRQEKISPPNRLKSEVTPEDRKDYKEKLINSVKNLFPVIENIDRKSDYYTYFYFHGLGLLNEKGTFTFITSNSWLDVGYGKNLQEFLCKYIPIHAIYDNPKRSFAHADVNTIIALFGAPEVKQGGGLSDWVYGESSSGSKKAWPNIKHTAKFVMFKKPFEEVLSAKNLIEIDNVAAKIKGESITDYVKNVVTTHDFRIFPIVQEDLLDDGWEYSENRKKEKNGRFKSGSYEGNKWSGKYLKAPDIFYTILEKGRGKFIELGKIAKVRRGFTTGANEFFYLDEEAQKKWKIEKEFLKPVIKSPKECESIFVDTKKLKFKVFMCNKPKSELKGTNALKYIEWGENQIIEIKSGGDKGKKIKGYHKLETIKNRKYWYYLGSENVFESKIVLKKGYGVIFTQNINPANFYVDQTFYYWNPSKHDWIYFVNSSLFNLLINLSSSEGLGEGLLRPTVEEFEKIFVLNSDFDFSKLKNKNFFTREIKSIFQELGINPDKPIRDQEPKPLPDRAELDKIIFDELGLTKEERKEVYWSVCELVKQRIEKAKSLNND